MIRLFEQHHLRREKELEVLWEFMVEGSQKRYQLPVPGCWEQHPEFSSYRGKGTFRKKLYVEEKGTYRLEFKGVSHTADVYFDGTLVAHHYNAYTPFSTILKEIEQGEHEITVVVDNSFSESSSLHIPNDYYTYGGITRPVSIAKISDTFIKKVHFTSYQEQGEWWAEIKVCLQNTENEAQDVSISCTLGDALLVSEVTRVAGNTEKNITFTKEFPSVSEWSHENPMLYELCTTLYHEEEAIDDLIERVGFRTVELRENKIYVNGNQVFLKGFNRHEDYATVGCAIPVQLMIEDMEIMQDLGVNALRTCHYPNDERFLDLCDERGILVWEENHARGLELEAMKNPNFDQQCEDCIREMIDNHYNHPSIILWGILNECASDTLEGREKYQRQYEQIKQLDRSRPTTSASCKHYTDICLDLPDVVSFNLYSGWYNSDPIEETKEKQLAFVKSTGGNGKPFIMSEFGAGAIYGYRDRSRCKWSEERQADILEESLKVYMKEERISGVFIWQFADCRVTEEGEWFKTRARCHNNKGVVDEFRRPKLSYDIVKKMFHSVDKEAN